MTNGPSKSGTSTASGPAEYAQLLTEIKARVQSARVRASLAANRELLSLYWDIGRLILDRQKKVWYAAKAVEHGWSRNVLALQIEAGLHERQGKAVTNFQQTLTAVRVQGSEFRVQDFLCTLSSVVRPPSPP